MLANLNYVHILVATLVYFILGSLWYSVLFGKTWSALLNLTVTEEDKKGMPKLFAATFVLNFIITVAMASALYFIAPSSILGALKVGILIGGGFVTTTLAMNYMYAKRPFKLLVIDAGYHIIALCAVAVVLTLWH